LIDRVKVALDVAVDNEPVATTPCEADRLQRLRSASLGTKTVRAVLEACFKDRLDHDIRRHLRHTIAHRRNTQRPLLPVRLRNVPPAYRLRAILARFEVVTQSHKELRHALLLDRLQGLPIDAGSPPVALDTLPRLHQDVTPVDPVVQRVKAPLRASLGSDEKPALEFSHFVYGVVGPFGHALALTSIADATKAGPLPSGGVVVTALPGTTSPSDSLPARHPFAFGL
jgi:hypothetical protein